MGRSVRTYLRDGGEAEAFSALVKRTGKPAYEVARKAIRQMLIEEGLLVRKPKEATPAEQ